MKSPRRIDAEIEKLTDYVNSFARYDPGNQAQVLGFHLLHALQWARGRRVKKPMDYLATLADRLPKGGA